MMHKIINSLTDIHIKQLHKLYEGEWWSCKRSMEDTHRILKNSSLIFAVITSDNTLVAFARVLSDYCYFAYIYDVIVKTAYRKKGIGDILMNAILKHPELENLSGIELVCRKDMIGFYQQYGFSPDYGESTAMRKLSINSSF